MKTNMMTNMKGLSKVALLALVAVVSIFASGCGKKGNSSNVGYYGYGVNPACQNCGVGANTLLSSALGERRASQSEPTTFQIGLEFYGTQATNWQGGHYGGQQYQYPTYTGSTTAQGTMTMNVNGPNRCNLPMGQYTFTLSTIRAGQVQNGTIYDLSLQAVGNLPMTITLTNTQINNYGQASIGFDGRQYPSRLQNDIILNVNGYQCRYVIE